MCIYSVANEFVLPSPFSILGWVKNPKFVTSINAWSELHGGYNILESELQFLIWQNLGFYIWNRSLLTVVDVFMLQVVTFEIP